MKKTIAKTKDFFSMYRTNEIRKVFFSGWIAVFAAFSMVWLYHGDIDMNWLMASVSSVAETPRMEADLIVEKKANQVSLIFGAKAEKVDRIELTLLSDPTRLRSLSSTNPDVSIVSDVANWAYQIAIDTHGKDISTGTVVADFVADMQEGAPFILSDTVFVSNGSRYAITSKSE
jgi:hypothetical protein